MCGRFTLAAPGNVVAEVFGLGAEPLLLPRFNIAPTQPVAVVRGGEDGPRLDELRWGLVPFWASDPAIGNKLVNARAETLAEKPAFRAAYRARRCLVVADGFYEWAPAPGRKQPWYFRLASRSPFGFAGLWERWQGAGAAALETCTIVTTAANPLVGKVHDRMPVILPDAAARRWLDPAARPGPEFEGLLRPFPAEEMEAFRVGLAVGNPGNDSPALIDPL